MPPKRKASKTDSESRTVTESETVKPKRGRKAEEILEVEANGVDHEEIEVPKRSTRANTSASSGPKPKKATKTKAPVEDKISEVEETPSEDPLSEDAPEPPESDKPAKRGGRKLAIIKPVKEEKPKRGKKVPVETVEPVEEKPNRRAKKPAAEPKEDAPEKKAKRGAKAKKPAAEDNAENDKQVKKPKLLNKTETDWNSIDFMCNKKNDYNLIISSWNIGGIKSWTSKGCLEYLNQETPDIFCVQEVKCDESSLPVELKELNLYKQYWCPSKKKGYAGVGLFSIPKPKNVTYGICDEDQDEDGRCITAEYDRFYLVNVYVPNAGRKLVTLPKRLDWNNSFKEYVKKLEEHKPVIICGDMNVSHQEIDLARPKNNTKNAGFTKEERDGMTEFLEEGFVDAYRHIYPDEKDVYSFWTYMGNARSKNIGWRLDYFIVSEKLLRGVCDVKYRTEVLGSDHCPVTLFTHV